MNGKVVGYDTAAIQKMYGNYVKEWDGKDRHNPEVHTRLRDYAAFTAGAFPANTQFQGALYDRMMDCAVEFEESGFVAGFKYALSLLQDPTSPVRMEPTHNTSEAETTPQEAPQEPKAPETPPVTTENAKAVSDSEKPKPQGTHAGSITSREIAKMFEVTHGNVVRRIENMILPRLDAERKEFFRLDVEMTPRHRRYKVYRLNKAACELYLEEMKLHQQFINVVGGLVKMKELMKEVFPAEVSAS